MVSDEVQGSTLVWIELWKKYQSFFPKVFCEGCYKRFGQMVPILLTPMQKHGLPTMYCTVCLFMYHFDFVAFTILVKQEPPPPRYDEEGEGGFV